MKEEIRVDSFEFANALYSKMQGHERKTQEEMLEMADNLALMQCVPTIDHVLSKMHRELKVQRITKGNWTATFGDRELHRPTSLGNKMREICREIVLTIYDGAN